MFEKFSNLDVDSAGRGGEYTVQVRIICGVIYIFPLHAHHVILTGWLRMDQRRGFVGCQYIRQPHRYATVS
jgi:hypothetical protein